MKLKLRLKVVFLTKKPPNLVSLNEKFLCTEKMVFCKIVTKSGLHCTWLLSMRNAKLNRLPKLYFLLFSFYFRRLKIHMPRMVPTDNSIKCIAQYDLEVSRSSCAGEVRHEWIARATQQLLWYQFHDFLAIFAPAHSKINQIA